MEFTRRYWAGVGLILGIGVLATILTKPMLLLASASIGAWLIAQQYLFAILGPRTLEALTVNQWFDDDRITTEESTNCVVEASLPSPSPVAVRVELAPPVSADVPTEVHCEIAPDEREKVARFSVEFHVAGRVRFEPPTVTVSDRVGLFRIRCQLSDPADLAVEPVGPQDIYVRGHGEPLVAFGTHRVGKRSFSPDVADTREYIPGDPVRRMDWKATARLDQPHVREFEVETEVVTAIVLDDRSKMRAGPVGRTKLDYAAQIALGLVNKRRSTGEPIALYAVSESGISYRQPPGGTTEHYGRARHYLQSISRKDHVPPNESSFATNRTVMATTPRTKRVLQTDTTAWGTKLGPLVSVADTGKPNRTRMPLYHATSDLLDQLRLSLVTVIITDDTEREEVRATVREAATSSERVVVYLTPTVLYELEDVTDVEDAYERYANFETFERELSQIKRVTTYEVAPDDPLDLIGNVREVPA